jgi:hypothetical protein
MGGRPSFGPPRLYSGTPCRAHTPRVRSGLPNIERLSRLIPRPVVDWGRQTRSNVSSPGIRRRKPTMQRREEPVRRRLPFSRPDPIGSAVHPASQPASRLPRFLILLPGLALPGNRRSPFFLDNRKMDHLYWTNVGPTMRGGAGKPPLPLSTQAIRSGKPLFEFILSCTQMKSSRREPCCHGAIAREDSTGRPPEERRSAGECL